MSDWLVSFLTSIVNLVADSAPLLLLGFVLAGLLKVLVPEEWIFRQLGGDRFRSVLLAALYGIPLPLCSCSVLPLAQTLKKSGAGKGATTAFLISTPETGVDSIALTYALFDPLMTIARPLAALVSALVSGALVNSIVRRGWDSTREEAAAECGHDHPQVDLKRTFWRRALSYSFGPLLDDLSGWLILGFLLSGILAATIPQGFFGTTVPTGWTSSLLMILVGTPMYICASATTPVAAALVAKGLDPGAALVLLLVGPATNIGTILVVGRSLGWRVLTIYLAVIIAVALLFSGLVNGLYSMLDLDLASKLVDEADRSRGWVYLLSALLLSLLVLRSALRTGVIDRWGRRLEVVIGFHPFTRPFGWMYGALALLFWASTAVSSAGPGEVLWVARFGKIVREVEGPGYCVHLPSPIDDVRRLRRTAQRIEEVGFSRDGNAPPSTESRSRYEPGKPAVERSRSLEDESEVMTGDGFLVRVVWSVTFCAQDSRIFQYGLRDVKRLVRVYAESALREEAGRLSIFDVLIERREDLRRGALSCLQKGLDAIQAGVEVIDVSVVFSHPPSRVHWAFCDLASAYEDRDTAVLRQQGERSRMLAEARSQKSKEVGAASVEAGGLRALARGGTDGLMARMRSFARHEQISRLRLWFAAQVDVLKDASTWFLLGGNVDLEIWQGTPIPAGIGSLPEDEGKADPDAEEGGFLEDYRDK